MSRFNYVTYDQRAQNIQNQVKKECEELEQYIEQFLPNGRAKALALTSLEEMYMWIGKAIRDDQIDRNSPKPVEE